MMANGMIRISAVASAVVLVSGATVGAQEHASRSSLSLRAPTVQSGGGGGESGHTLSGPYFLRSADPEAPGEVEVKFIYEFENNDHGDQHGIELEIEWGLVEDWEFILEIPAVIGDGAIEGNGDATVGFHTRLWREEGMMPAFAVRNMFRLPTGYHGQDFDYTLRGLMTWTLSDTTRLHFNPFLSAVNEHDDDEENFQWGAAIGIDHRVSDDFLLVLDYQNGRSGEGSNDQSIEVGADLNIGEGQKLGLGIDFDVDDFEDEFTAKISYIVEIEGSRIDG